MDGQYTVFKNDEGGTGFYYQTALGKKLNEFSRKWNQKLYGKPSVDGVEFKLNLGTAPFNGAVTVIKPTGRTHVDTKIKPENPVVLGKDGQPGPAHLKVEVARNQKDAAGQTLPDKEYASVTVAAPKNIDELPGGTLLRDGTEKGKALLPLDDNGIAKPPREPEYHVTLFTPDEMAYIKEHYPEKYEELKKTGFQVDGEPKGVKVERRTSDRGRMFIMTVDWPEAIKLRESLGLKRHDLHVSLSANDARYATKKDPNAPTPKKSWEEKK